MSTIADNLTRLADAGQYTVIGGPTRSRGAWLWWCNSHPQADHSGRNVTHATGATPEEAVATVCAALLVVRDEAVSTT